MKLSCGLEHWNNVSGFLLYGKTWTYENRGAEAIQRSSCSQKLSKLYLWLLFDARDNAVCSFYCLVIQSDWLTHEFIKGAVLGMAASHPLGERKRNFSFVRLGLEQNDKKRISFHNSTAGAPWVFQVELSGILKQVPRSLDPTSLMKSQLNGERQLSWNKEWLTYSNEFTWEIVEPCQILAPLHKLNSKLIHAV